MVSVNSQRCISIRSRLRHSCQKKLSLLPVTENPRDSLYQRHNVDKYKIANVYSRGDDRGPRAPPL